MPKNHSAVLCLHCYKINRGACLNSFGIKLQGGSSADYNMVEEVLNLS